MSLSSAYSAADETVMAALDDAGPTMQFIIADITCHEAWLSIPASDALVIGDWR